MKRYLSTALVLLITILIGSSIATAQKNADENADSKKLQPKTGHTMISNDTYTLSLDNTTGSFQLVEKAGGVVWQSNPDSEDPRANGLGKQWLQSQFIVEYYNVADNLNETASFGASVQKGGLTVYADATGIRCDYEFPKEEFSISVEYQLNDDGLQASIPYSRLKENGDCKLASIMLLPYFTSVGSTENGYLLLPDGCGTIIELTEQENEISNISYEKTIYGRNKVLTLKQQATAEEDLLFPVFASCTEKGLLGIVTEGDAISNLSVIGEGNKTGYSAVRPLCTVRDKDTIVLYEGTTHEVTNTTYEPTIVYQGNFTVQYRTLTQSPTYSDIAGMVADYYKEQYSDDMDRTIKNSLRIETIGSVKKQVNRFGIPMLVDYVLTGFSEADDMLENLEKDGVDSVKLLYYGIYTDGVYSKMPASGKIEGSMDKENLSELFKSHADIIPMINLVNIYESGNGISVLQDASQNIRGTKAEVKKIALNTGVSSVDTKNHHVLRSTLLAKLYSKVTEKNSNEGFTFFGDAGIHTLSSDYTKKKEISRQEALENYREVMKGVYEQFSGYTVENFYGYMLPYVTDIAALPQNSSMLDAFSYDIPFAQMILSDFASYSATPLNCSANREKSMMKILEYGGMPFYKVMTAERAELQDTYIATETIGTFDNYRNEMATDYKRASEFYNDVGDRLVSHSRLSSGVYLSEYTNGRKVIFNYNDKDYVYNNATISAVSYAVVE